jgi:hypothetical protein
MIKEIVEFSIVDKETKKIKFVVIVGLSAVNLIDHKQKIFVLGKDKKEVKRLFNYVRLQQKMVLETHHIKQSVLDYMVVSGLDETCYLREFISHQIKKISDFASFYKKALKFNERKSGYVKQFQIREFKSYKKKDT